MERRSFADVLKSAKIDIRREYDRLYSWFFKENATGNNYYYQTLHDCCEEDFYLFPGKGTCVSLKDFEETYDFGFDENPHDFDINYLLNFCEYAENITRWTQHYSEFNVQIEKVIDLIGYSSTQNGYYTCFIPNNQAAISVSEIVDEKTGYKVLDYNHRSIKGNLEAKLSILKLMADEIEPRRKELAGICKTLTDQLFQMLNKFVRHAHEETPYILTISKDELEQWYDDIYQMWLLAMLELDNLERKKRVADVLREINGK